MPPYLAEFTVQLLTPIAAALGAWLVAEVIRLIRSRVANQHLQGALYRATVAVAAAVGKTSQTFVDDLRDPDKPGAWTPDRGREALARAVADSREYLGPRGLAELRAILGSDDEAVDRWIVGLIEARVQEAKR